MANPTLHATLSATSNATHHAMFSAQDPFGNVRAGFEGRATINRKDWGIEYNAVLETGGVLISEKINLEFDVSAVHAA